MWGFPQRGGSSPPGRISTKIPPGRFYSLLAARKRPHSFLREPRASSLALSRRGDVKRPRISGPTFCAVVNTFLPVMRLPDESVHQWPPRTELGLAPMKVTFSPRRKKSSTGNSRRLANTCWPGAEARADWPAPPPLAPRHEGALPPGPPGGGGGQRHHRLAPAAPPPHRAAPWITLHADPRQRIRTLVRVHKG